MFLVPNRSVPNAQAGMGLPVVLDDETLEIVGEKVRRARARRWRRASCWRTRTIFSPIPEQEMSEPEFFNRLHAETGCGMILDLHNLYANTINLGHLGRGVSFGARSGCRR